MSSDEIQEAKNKFLNSVKPKYIELYGALEPDLLFIDKSLFDENSVVSIDAEIIFVDEPEHIAWHKKKHIEDLIKMGSDGSMDKRYALTEWYEPGTPRPEDIFNDVFCDFEIKAYIGQGS